MLTILCAHKAEAEPLIGGFGLAHSSANPNLFEGQEVRLLLTGQGPAQCAESLERIGHMLEPRNEGRWLNFGVAGAGNCSGWTESGPPLSGALFAVNHLTYGDSDWRLIIPADLNPDTDCQGRVDRVGRCVSVDVPERRFTEVALYDMEAAAIASFLQQRQRLSSLVVVKLVTDGSTDDPADGISIARKLLRQNRDRIVAMAQRLAVA